MLIWFDQIAILPFFTYIGNVILCYPWKVSNVMSDGVFMSTFI